MIHRPNYHQVNRFLNHLAKDNQLDPDSIGHYKEYLNVLLRWADETPLCLAHTITPSLPDYLAMPAHYGLGAESTLKKTVQTIKRALTWLKLDSPTEFKPLPSNWLEALCPPNPKKLLENRLAVGEIQAPPPEHVFSTLEEVLQLISLPRDKEDIAKWRDQAAVAMMFSLGIRATAFGSLPIMAVNLRQREIRQWPDLGVRTKNNKKATTYLLEIPQLMVCIEEWDAYVRSQLPVTAMWYTPIISRWGVQQLSPLPAGKRRGSAIDKRLHKLYEEAQMPYLSAHKLRHGHAVFALSRCKTMADYKAVSTNLMHEDITTTDKIYAPLLSNDVHQRIASLVEQPPSLPIEDSELAAYLQSLSKDEMRTALHILAEMMAR